LRQELENHRNGVDQPVSTQAKMMPAVMSVPPRESVAQAVQKSDARVSNTRESGTPASAIPTSSTATADAAQEAAAKEPAPLSFKIGSAYITPVGFMDFTFVGRSVTTGSGIGTNFGNIPFNNTMQGHLTETRLSAQNSRFGVRVDTKVKNASILGYLESDFLGFVPTNAAVSSNSYSFRLRLYWAQIRQGKFEVLGGQSWSLLTPGRKGISPLPGDLFYSQNIDTNYQAGLVWGRIPQFRFVYHASNTVAVGFSAENPEQYIGGSAGGGTVTLPSALATAYGAQLNNGTTTLNVPNLHPDMVAKIAFDPKVGKRDLHFEVGGVVRSFKLFNPNSMQAFTTTGGGGQVNINFELFKNFRLVTNNFFSDGGGRYIFGQAPDLVVRADGSASLVHSLSTVSGLEVQARKNTLLYGYYGGVYIQRNIVIDANGNMVGYGYIGSGNGQNRSIQEGTFGFTHTFWRDPKYGALQFMGQYSYLTRNPWFVATGQPDAARANIFFLNLRYALPGSAPAKVE
ncbi:MAG: hypothetical protein J2P31_14290, partial [Blastocatellia bacterium]|nr:hypothetical protein [Blastocatellia bacterium]